MSRYAYIRVSSKDQNVARQVRAMTEIGLQRNEMYIDKESGKDFNRKGYRRLLKKLKRGDELYTFLPIWKLRYLHKFTVKTILNAYLLQVNSVYLKSEKKSD